MKDRFWNKVNKDGPYSEKCKSNCWIWTAYTDSGGYGRFRFGRKLVSAHRFSYELIKPIPEGLEIDHLCKVRNCVNPAHLEPVTKKENILRGESFAAKNAKKTHCPYGHPYQKPYQNNRRFCPVCKWESEKRRRFKKTGHVTKSGRKVMCKRGHPYSEHGRIAKNGQWVCKICKRITNKNRLKKTRP